MLCRFPGMRDNVSAYPKAAPWRPSAAVYRGLCSPPTAMNPGHHRLKNKETKKPKTNNQKIITNVR